MPQVMIRADDGSTPVYLVSRQERHELTAFVQCIPLADATIHEALNKIAHTISGERPPTPAERKQAAERWIRENTVKDDILTFS